MSGGWYLSRLPYSTYDTITLWYFASLTIALVISLVSGASKGFLTASIRVSGRRCSMSLNKDPTGHFIECSMEEFTVGGDTTPHQCCLACPCHQSLLGYGIL